MRWPGGLPDVPCARCGRRVSGLALGDRCLECTTQLRRRASRLGGRIALAATVITAIFVAARLPPDPTARYYGILAVAVTYILVRRIAQRIAMEVMR
jgi:hypothetical protein